MCLEWFDQSVETKASRYIHVYTYNGEGILATVYPTVRVLTLQIQDG